MSASSVPGRTPRDPRLDFFRGLAMFFIFIAHVPKNPWMLWIPARFGYSDAAEIFVFCSGMASAFAFGRIFVARGWYIGTARILYRAWQIYWVHIGLFVALAATLAGLDATGRVGDYHVGSLNLKLFFDNAQTAMFGLLTLTYVPNYFDILPMYFGILLMVPLVVAAHRVGLWFAIGLVVALWLGAQADVLALPAEPWSERTWFFNPFGWQLVFFTGFAFVSGWIPAPPVRGWLIALALAVIVISVPFATWEILQSSEFTRAVFETLKPLSGKTEQGILRTVHFFALAYLAWVAAGPGGIRLRTEGMLRPVVAVIHKVGQQALATFVTGMFLARMMPVVFEVFGRNAVTVPIVNLTGFAALIATAYTVSWLKAEKGARAPARVPTTPAVREKARVLPTRAGLSAAE